MIDAWKYAIELTDLLNQNNLWRLHSRFDNGINLINQADQLLFIGTDKNGELPFAIHLTFLELTKLKKQLTTNSWLYLKDGCFYDTTNPNFKLLIENCSLYSSSIQQQKTPLNQESAEKLIALAKKQSSKNGFNFSLGETKRVLIEEASDFQRAFQQLMSDNTTSIEAGLRFFIGRGMGLTPSGDDFIVGILSIQRAFALFNPLIEEILAKLVSSEKLTTDISQAYLSAAEAGHFSTTLVQLSQCLATNSATQKLEPLLVKLLQNGHTSGVDTATGIVAGLLARAGAM